MKENNLSSFSRILLIDDVTGSGASLNETAGKLRAQNMGTTEMIGFSLVGNIKGFDVIKDI